MSRKLIPVILASTTLLTGCFEEKAKESTAAPELAPSVSKEDAVAIVNGKYISKKTLQTLENEIAQRSRGQSFPKEQLIEELIQRELLVQDAIQKQLDKSPEVIERMQTVKSSLLSQAALQNYLKSNPVTDEEIKAEYDSKMGGTGEEYKARHILVKTEDEAKKLIEELDAGSDFIELAKTKSTGPSGPQGGDLGWFTADRMVAPFSEAVIAMENGKFTSEPVETQFGWHVILREDSRAQTPPPLDAVKEQIRPMLQRTKVQTMMENLRKQAKVEILVPLTEEIASEQPQSTTESAESPAQESAAGQVVTEVVESAAETAGAAVEKADDVAEQVKNKIEESAQSITEKGADVVKESVDSAKAVADSANQSLDAVIKP